MNSTLILSILLSILIYIILEDNLFIYYQLNKFIFYINENLLIGVLVFFLCYFIFDLLDKNRKSYERFTLIETPNVNSLDNEDSIKISINNIQKTFTNNSFFGFKYNNFILLLDDIAYDYINIKNQCNINKFKSFTYLTNIDDLITVESKKSALKTYLIEYIRFIPNNIISIRNEVNNIIHLLFNEYLYNCS